MAGPTLAGRGLHIFKNNFGQQADLDVLQLAYEKHKKSNPDHKMLIWGCSRGAAVACTFVCTESADTANHVQLVVLEGCFESSASVIEKRFKRFGKRGVERIKKFFEKRTGWRENAISPLAVLDQWPDNVPVLFVTSRKDTVVPMECTINCVKQLKACKPNTDIYLLVLKNSSHSGYAFDDAGDRALYENVLHAFYNKHGWKYDERKAALGMRHLEKCKQ
jgi:alpha-beta hydrolase superfamily lysophospholipase